MCAGADEGSTSGPAASPTIVDDITCERLVGHIVEVSAAHFRPFSIPAEPSARRLGTSSSARFQ
jgi:hypothetical protein